MAQIYSNDSKMLISSGRTQQEYQLWSYYDPLKMTITDSLQGGDLVGTDDPKDPLYEQMPPWKQHVWFWIPAFNEYRKMKPDKHALLSAAEELFQPARWTEIIDALESRGGISQYLDQLNLPIIRRKAQKARDLGYITAAELQNLADIL